jgi:hypothetical protein
MSDISIVIPLEALPDGVPLDGPSLIAALQDTASARREADQTKEAYNSLIKTWNSMGTNLELILDELDGFDKVQALRQFVQTLKDARMLELK